MVSLFFEWISCKKSLTKSRILRSSSSSKRQISEISPLIFIMSFKAKWDITLKQCLQTWDFGSWRQLKNFSFLDSKVFVNLLYRSPTAIKMLPFTNESKLGSSNISNSKSMTFHFWSGWSPFTSLLQKCWETRQNLHKVKIVTLSR